MNFITKKCLLIFLSGFLAQGIFAAGNKMYVAVKEAAITEKASARSALVGKIEYGRQVSVKETKKDWCHITTDDGIEGWISEKSLSAKKIPSKKISADAKEIALAGKGWSSPMEEAYSDISGLDFSLIDTLEAVTVLDDDVILFITEGKLNLGGLE